MGRLWTAALGGEALYAEDLPTCCRRDSRGVSGEAGEVFECSVCGAIWESADTVTPEVCAFGFQSEDERRGAA